MDERRLHFNSSQHKLELRAALLRGNPWTLPLTAADMAKYRNMEELLPYSAQRDLYRNKLLRQMKPVTTYAIANTGEACQVYLKIPLFVFKKFLFALKLEAGIYSLPPNRKIHEALVVAIGYAAQPVCMYDILLNFRVRPYEGLSFYPIVIQIYKSLIARYNINFPTREEVLDDERSFSEAGFPGCVLAIDFRLISVNGWPCWVLSGVNFHGKRRLFQVLHGMQSEGDAFQSSEFYTELKKEGFGKLNWPNGFEIQVSASETKRINTYALIDQELNSDFFKMMTPEIKLRLVNPVGWSLEELRRHNWFQKENITKVFEHLANVRWVAEENISMWLPYLKVDRRMFYRTGKVNSQELAMLLFQFKVMQAEEIKKHDPFQNRNYKLAEMNPHQSAPVEDFTPMTEEVMLGTLLEAYTFAVGYVKKPLPVPKTDMERLYILKMEEKLLPQKKFYFELPEASIRAWNKYCNNEKVALDLLIRKG